MKRYVFVILFFLVLVVPLTLRWVMGRYLVAHSTIDGPPLLIISPHSESIRREFADAFSEWHKQKFGQPVSVNYLSFGGGTDIRRSLEARASTTFKQTGSYEIDLIWGGGHDLLEQLRPHLQPVELPVDLMKSAYPNATLAGLPLYDLNTHVDAQGNVYPKAPAAWQPGFRQIPLWFGTALSSFGITYNKDVLKQLNIPEPKTWRDLTDPRLRGWIVLADPTRSASANTAFMVIVERAMVDAVEKLSPEDQKDPAKKQAALDFGWADGMGMIRQICANARNFNDSAQSLPSVVSSGDVAVAMAIDFFARSQIAFVGDSRMGYVEPANATIINPDPIGLVKGAPNRETAVRFIEFLLQPKAQRLWNVAAGQPDGPKISSLRRLPIVRSVYDNPVDFTDPVNPFEQTSSFNTDRSRTKSFPVLGFLIEASCMDLLDELRETRKTILDSPKAAELDAKLARFPFDQPEALRRGDMYRRATALDRLHLMRQWTNEFREEYRRLREAAGN